MNPETTSTQVEKTRIVNPPNPPSFEELLWMMNIACGSVGPLEHSKDLEKVDKNAARRRRYAEDSDYRAKCIASSAAYTKRRYRRDHLFRLKKLADSKKRYANDPVYRAVMASRVNLRRARIRALKSPPALLSLLATSQVVSQSLNTIESNG